MLRKRQLGPTDLQVPAIALGTNVLGWTVSERDAFPLLDHALDHGLNFITRRTLTRSGHLVTTAASQRPLLALG